MNLNLVQHKHKHYTAVSVSFRTLCKTLPNPYTQSMEDKQQEQAGPSSLIDNTKQQIAEKPSRNASEDEEDEEELIDHDKNGPFVPGPLLSLKEQIEKDKVLDSAIFLSSVVCINFL